jgi:hypothetical protein
MTATAKAIARILVLRLLVLRLLVSRVCGT